MREWFADEKAGAATGGTVKVVTRSAEQRVVRWGAIKKFSRGRRRFYPSFSKTKEVRVVCVDDIRQSSRMDRMENRANVERALYLPLVKYNKHRA